MDNARWLATRTAALFLSLSSVLAAADTHAITLTPIQTLGRVGDELSDGVIRLRDINDKDVVVGNSKIGNGQTRGFRWDSQAGTINLGTLGGDASIASGINESGTIAGGARRQVGNDIHVARRLPGASGWQDLGDFGALINANGDGGINDRGDIALHADGPNVNGPGTFTRQGKIRLANGTVRNLQLSNRWGQPRALNNSGNTVGTSGRGNGQRASFWQLTGSGALPLTRIGPTDGFFKTSATDINNKDQVVGTSSGEGASRAFVWQPSFGAGGALALLHTENVDRSGALSLNDDGSIVGWIEDTAGRRRAALWHQDRLIDLNDVLPPELDGWTLLEAQVINDAGSIGGVGSNPDGNIAGFLLTDTAAIFDPAAVPAPAAMGPLILVLAALLRRC